MAKDARFKEYLTKLLSDNGVKAQSALKVGELPLEIDLFLTFKDGDDLKLFTPIKTVLDHCGAKRLVVEYKSENDLLKLNHLYKLIAYRALYLSSNLRNIPPAEVGLLAITTQFPKKVLQTFEAEVLQQGVFLLHFEFPLYIIVINYLPISEENYGLVFFSSGETLKTFIRTISRKENLTKIE